MAVIKYQPRTAEAIRKADTLPRNQVNGFPKNSTPPSSGGSSAYKGFFKVTDITDGGDSKVKIVWGGNEDNVDSISGICQINGMIREISKLESETFSGRGYIYLQWEWDDNLLTPTLEFVSLLPVYETNFLKWPLAYVDTSGSLAITQVWLGGYFQASLWGEC